MHPGGQQIVLVEPWFTASGHIPFNRAFLAIVREAFPAAQITFACSAQYRSELEENHHGRGRIDHWIEAAAWTQSTIDGGIGEFWRRARWLVRLFSRIRGQGITPTHVVILGSSGPLLLAACAAKILRLPARSSLFAVLHGADEIVHGWQPRNPLRRLLTFRSAIGLLSRLDIKVIALESFIAQELRERFPGQAQAILCIPHGYDEAEAGLTGAAGAARATAAAPLRILFLGQATPQKGFAEFVSLAERARAAQGGQMEFRAAGALRRDTRNIDQSALARRAGDEPLERSELLAELSSADLVFTWQSEHYQLKPSGMLLDCINLAVPMVGRRSHAITMLEAEYGACGLFADDVESVYSALVQLTEVADRRRRISVWSGNLGRARIARGARSLGAIARRELEA
jgi:hypothetical protein